MEFSVCTNQWNANGECHGILGFGGAQENVDHAIVELGKDVFEGPYELHSCNICLSRCL